MAYGAGATLFRSTAGGVAVALTQLAQLGLSRDGTGSFESLALPATAGRLLLVPVVLALTFWLLEVGWRQPHCWSSFRSRSRGAPRATARSGTPTFAGRSPD